ncbi:MAG: hypothetical protein OSB62_00910 [Alphaproteobacteria bacterium]|nr:hypothetical protein [Alphaproteobacteria bacterium]
MSAQRSSNHIKMNPATGMACEYGKQKTRYNAHATTRRDEERRLRRTTKGKTLRSLRAPKHAAASFRRMLHQKSGASIA